MKAAFRIVIAVLTILASSTVCSAATFTYLGQVACSSNECSNGGDGTVHPVTISVNAGNLIVLFLNTDASSGGSVTPTGCSDGSNGAYTHATGSLVQHAGSGADTVTTDIWYVLSAASTGSVTITCTFSGTIPTYVNLIPYWYSYTGTATFDKATVDSGTNNTSAGTLTTAHANELIFSGIGGLTVFFVPSGYAHQETQYGIAADLADAGTAGSNNIFWSFTSAGNYTQSNAAFYTTGGGGLTPKQKARGFFGIVP